MYVEQSRVDEFALESLADALTSRESWFTGTLGSVALILGERVSDLVQKSNELVIDHGRG